MGYIKSQHVNYMIESANEWYAEQAELLVKHIDSINLESQFDALKAYNAISNKCYDLHKGADGISKTWKQVDIHVKALVVNTSFNSIRQEDSNRIGYVPVEEVFARHEFMFNR